MHFFFPGALGSAIRKPETPEYKEILKCNKIRHLCKQ